MSNRSLPDELADVRAEICAMEARADKIREVLIANPASRNGDEWLAAVTQQTRETINTALLKQRLGRNALREFLRTQHTTIVNLKRKESE